MREKYSIFEKVLFVALSIGLLIQLVHFVEHAVQFSVWVFGNRQAPYMSPLAMTLGDSIGRFVYGDYRAMCGVGPVQITRQSVVAMELLHLVGNSLFLGTLGAAYYFRRSRYIRWGFYVETFHLYEHIMLTMSVLYVGQPVGLSTLFGSVETIGGHSFAVGYRVFWHFAMNLVPSAMLMMSYAESRRLRSSSPDDAPALVSA